MAEAQHSEAQHLEAQHQRGERQQGQQRPGERVRVLTGTWDHQVLGLASANDGVVTRSQLLGLGMGSSTIDRQIGTGLLRIASRGVYVAELLTTPVTPMRAALAAVPRGALCRRTAAQLHGLKVPSTRPELLVLNSTRTRLSGIDVAQTRYLPTHHVTEVAGLRTTTIERTLCDLAAVVGPQRLKNLVEQWLHDAPDLAHGLASCHLQLARRGRNGTVAMRELLSGLLADEPVLSSELERALWRRLLAAALPLRAQYRPPWYDGIRGIVDFADPVGRTVLEADGRSFHSTSQAFFDDRRRDREAARHGWVVLRVTARDVLTDNGVLEEVFDTIRARQPKAA